MTAQPTAFGGRKLPLNDWENDDHTPGAGGHPVTCTDTSLGRVICWATNGRVCHDGSVYRAAIPYDPDGITLDQAAVAARKVAGVTLFIPEPGSWSWSKTSSFLMAGNALIVQGWYDRLPREYRFQDGAAFGHAMAYVGRSRASGVRVYDPLNPDLKGHGKWMPAGNARAFLENRDGTHPELHYRLAFVPLQHL